MSEQVADKRKRIATVIAASAVIVGLLVGAVSCSVDTLLSDPAGDSKSQKEPDPSFTVPSKPEKDADDDDDFPSDTSAERLPEGHDGGSGNDDGEAPNDDSDYSAMPSEPGDGSPYIPNPEQAREDGKKSESASQPPGEDKPSDNSDNRSFEPGGPNPDDDTPGSSPVRNPTPPPDENPGGGDDGSPGGDDTPDRPGDGSNGGSDGAGSDGSGSDSGPNGSSDGSSDAGSDGNGSDSGSDGNGSDSDSDSDGSDDSDGGGDEPETPAYPEVNASELIDDINERRGVLLAPPVVTEEPDNAERDYESEQPFEPITVYVTDGDAVDELFLSSALSAINLTKNYGPETTTVAHVTTEMTKSGVKVTVSYEVFTPKDTEVVDDDVTVSADGETIFSVLGNDTVFGDIAKARVEIIVPPHAGTAEVVGDRRIRYTPNAGATSDTIIYRVVDELDRTSSTATIKITVDDEEPSEPKPTEPPEEPTLPVPTESPSVPIPSVPAQKGRHLTNHGG